jgi:hypothetical protein
MVTVYVVNGVTVPEPLVVVAVTAFPGLPALPAPPEPPA